MNKKCILTSSSDGYVRIWSVIGELLGNVNINHPLPVSWRMSIDSHDKVKKRVFYALKIIDIMVCKYSTD